MIHGTKCNKQYVGETKLRRRFNEHWQPVDRPSATSPPLPYLNISYLVCDHSAFNILLIPIEQIFSSRDAIRKA